jgi:regulatory protein
VGRDKAYDRALALLTARARSVSELRRTLLRKGEAASEVDTAVSRLSAQGLLDDDDFARQYARGRIQGSGLSRRRIIQELARKGVSGEVAARAIAVVCDEDGVNPSSAMQRVAEKKWRSLTKLGGVVARRRLYAFLARRGFDPDEIRSAMSALQSGSPM